ncbi:MAG: hypothetical protein Q9188_001906 [Gyalolechia gomerana]
MNPLVPTPASLIGAVARFNSAVVSKTEFHQRDDIPTRQNARELRVCHLTSRIRWQGKYFLPLQSPLSPPPSPTTPLQPSTTVPLSQSNHAATTKCCTTAPPNNQPDCNAAATEMCNLIPSAAWKLHEWTKVDSDTCRAMVYHTDQMPVPTVGDCIQTFAGIISTCIIQLPDKNDDGSAPRIGEDVSKVEQDPSVTVYNSIRLARGSITIRSLNLIMLDTYTYIGPDWPVSQIRSSDLSAILVELLQLNPDLPWQAFSPDNLARYLGRSLKDYGTSREREILVRMFRLTMDIKVVHGFIKSRRSHIPDFTSFCTLFAIPMDEALNERAGTPFPEGFLTSTLQRMLKSMPAPPERRPVEVSPLQPPQQRPKSPTPKGDSKSDSSLSSLSSNEDEEPTESEEPTGDEESSPGEDDNPSENDPPESEESSEEEDEEYYEQPPPPPTKTFTITPELQLMIQKVRDDSPLGQQRLCGQLLQLVRKMEEGVLPRKIARADVRRILGASPGLGEEWVNYLNDTYGILDPKDLPTGAVGGQAGATEPLVASSSKSRTKKRNRVEKEDSEEKDGVNIRRLDVNK